ncbi:gamma-glutamyl hydrolase [Elysia marginata]|uniref:folate gamma-glutamyl hydrolase n=1 Tax=Elysia marginata TaxID=1093978 RepID=A0AAV4J1C0_9GAST|nr:gamma-glutamyl hydrolase [Elysia marginata]
MSQNRVNNRPIIGILTEPSFSKYGDEYIRSAYVQYLESAGARVVPIRGKQPPEYYTSLFKKINGVLFPGGGANTTHGPYYESGKAMYELAIKANDQGDYFPIWGTCLGLELFTVLTAKKWLLASTDSENLTLPLTFAEGYRHSHIFKNMPDDILTYLNTEPVTQNNHKYSMLTKDFKASSSLSKFYQVLSTNHGRDNLEFVSLMEAYKYPFYASQWHPEKNVFLWSANSAINHDFHAIRVSQYMANFFVNEARKSTHQFDSAQEEAREMIENYVRKFVPTTSFIASYYFNYTTKA